MSHTLGTPRLRTRVLLAGAVVVLGAGLVGCSNAAATAEVDTTDAVATTGAPQITAPEGGVSGQSAAATPTGSADDSTGQGNGGAAGGRGTGMRPGTSGLIAEVGDGTMEVQGDSAQTTVTWTDETTFTQQHAGTAADITVGSCVVAFGAAAGDGTTTGTAEVSTVQASSAENGTCSAGFGGGFPGGGGGMPGGRSGDGTAPTGEFPMPSGELPEGMTPPTGELPSGGGTGGGGIGGGGFGSVVAGLVTAVDGSTITVQGATDSTDTSTATVAADATVTVTAAATAEAVAVGLCATAQGQADEIGAVAATSVSLTDPVDGSCTSAGGFGGLRGGPGQGGTGQGGTGGTGQGGTGQGNG